VRARVKNLPIVGLSVLLFTTGVLWKINPLERKVVDVHEVRVVKRIEKVVIPKPTNVKHNSLSDASKACSGAPVVIEQISVSKPTGAGDNDSQVTWLRVRPAGDDYFVACRLDGSWMDMFKVGDLISIPQGKMG
jgi:hypothetical protein